METELGSVWRQSPGSLCSFCGHGPPAPPRHWEQVWLRGGGAGAPGRGSGCSVRWGGGPPGRAEPHLRTSPCQVVAPAQVGGQVLAAVQGPGDGTDPRAISAVPAGRAVRGACWVRGGSGQERGEQGGRGSSQCQPAVACHGTCQGPASREARELCQAVPARLGSDRLSWRAVQCQEETGLDLEMQPGLPAGHSGRHVVSPLVRSPGGRPRAVVSRRARVQGDWLMQRMLRVRGGAPGRSSGLRGTWPRPSQCCGQ